MKLESAIAAELRAAAERGDMAAVDRLFAGGGADWTNALRQDCAEAKATLVRKEDPRAVRAGVVAAWFVGLQVALRGMGWRARAERKAIESRIAGIAERLAALETRVDAGLDYLGTHEHGKAYRRNSAVTHDGSIWISLRETRQRPGDGPDWRLAVRKGRDAFK
jgi:hypothetical protein